MEGKREREMKGKQEAGPKAIEAALEVYTFVLLLQVAHP